MIEKHDILKMARHVFKRASGQGDNEIMHPDREWGTGIAVAFVIMLVGGYMAAATYLDFEAADVDGGDAGVSVVNYNEEAVKEANELYEARQQEFEELINAPAVPSDDGEDVATSTSGTEEDIVPEEVEVDATETEEETTDEADDEPERTVGVPFNENE